MNDRPLSPAPHSGESGAHEPEYAPATAAQQRVENPAAPANIQRFAGSVVSMQRTSLLRQRPVTIWLTGLSGAGKSTIAYELERRLIALGHPCYVLDGDNVRHGLGSDLGFTREDRRENIRRVAHVAQLMNDAGLIVITALISPMHEDRAMARAIIDPARFVETYLSASLETCAQRDPKGLYEKAKAGAIRAFTGISAPYEAPRAPDLRVDTATQSVDASVAVIFAHLRDKFLLTDPSTP